MSEEAILATFQQYADAYCAKDTDTLITLFDSGNDTSLIGTGADALCTGPDKIRAVFERNFKPQRPDSNGTGVKSRDATTPQSWRQHSPSIS